MGTDRKMWEWFASNVNGDFYLRTVDDGYTTSQAVMGFVRAGSGMGVSRVTLTAVAEDMRWDATGLGLSVTPTAKFHLSGVGQATASFAPGGAQGATAYIYDTGNAVGNGGAIMFADGHGPFCAIKSYVGSGTGPLGDLTFSLRRLAADTFFTETMRLTSTGTVNCAFYPVSMSATAVGAASTTQALVKGTNLGTLGLFYGTGVPAFAAMTGSLYIRTDGAANTRLYVCTVAAGTWAAVTTP
jgi:hypothetical protein